MWNYTCYLCDKTDSDDYLCTRCKDIKKIIACYSAEDIAETLEKVYLRDKKKCELKADVEMKRITRSQTEKN